MFTWRRAAFLASLAPYAIYLALPQTKATVSFTNDVQPLLKARCASCHSGSSASAGLDMASAKSILSVVSPGSSEKSVLIRRLKGLDGLPQMPMGFAPLSDAQIGKIADWIDSGAKVDGAVTHWAYVKPVRPSPPGSEKNAIDAFISARLSREGLKMSAPASKETLLRRVYLDLLGLPPSPKEIDEFLADKSPNAYEKVVDRLLANSHYGERMAMPWLDLSRYADSDGYEKDLNRTAFKYRDWLIQAFNRNEPYDQFTIDQIAGDLLPAPSVDQLVATGFNRNTLFNREGGVDQEEAQFNVVLDRVNTTSTVWLGSTLQCARCHDHKYDPFSQKDYYRFAAYFDNSQIYPRGPKDIGEEKWFEADIKVPTTTQAAESAKLDKEVARVKEELARLDGAIAPARAKWVASAKRIVWTPLESSVEVPGPLQIKKLADGSRLVSGPDMEQAEYVVKLDLPKGDWKALRLEVLPDDSLPQRGSGRASSGNFILSKVVARGFDIDRVAADYSQQGYSALGVLDDDIETGWAINPEVRTPHSLVLSSKRPPNGQVELRLQMSSKRWIHHTIGRFRLSATNMAEAHQYALPAKVEAAFSEPIPEKNKDVISFYRSIDSRAIRLGENLTRLNARKMELANEIPTALVMRDKPASGPLKTWLHNRGEFTSRVEEVESGVPASLSTQPASGNRLDLARWLASKDNPLTARVEVNRLWEMCFGRGLVETSEDFGTQGSRPSHPELLDWLACEFMDSGWDIKHVLKLIVTSKTYRQSSNATPLLLEKDPSNVLLARGPRFRLDAEIIRDSALKASGLLEVKIGGPSVFPVQPPNIWDTPYNGEQWAESAGADKYRRGMYTFLKRSSPYPNFLSFDATSRESCVVRRIRTNTPLQALAQLNDTMNMEAARALAGRMEREGGSDPLAYGFRLCTGRRPSTSELERLVKLEKGLLSKMTAGKLGETPGKAARVMVANVLLNLDETVTKS